METDILVRNKLYTRDDLPQGIMAIGQVYQNKKWTEVEVPFQLGALYHISARYWYIIHAKQTWHSSGKLYGVKVMPSNVEAFKEHLMGINDIYPIFSCLTEFKTVDFWIKNGKIEINSLKDIVYSNRDITMERYMSNQRERDE